MVAHSTPNNLHNMQNTLDHRNITTHLPRPNAQAEAFNKHLMKTVTATAIEQKNWKPRNAEVSSSV